MNCTITGIYTDPSGDPIAGALVTLTPLSMPLVVDGNETVSEPLSDRTDDNGVYTFDAPYPADCIPSNILWNLGFDDGNAWAGQIPANPNAGFSDLVAGTYGTAWSPASSAPLLTIISMLAATASTPGAVRVIVPPSGPYPVALTTDRARLTKGPTPGPPTAGIFVDGDLYRDSHDVIYFCITGGDASLGETEWYAVLGERADGSTIGFRS